MKSERQLRLGGDSEKKSTISARWGKASLVTRRLHEDEVHIDVGLVRKLIRTQLPQLADLEVRLVAAPGTDNVVFRLGDELSVRLPRKPAAVSGLLIEREWLPRLAAHLPLAVPERWRPGSRPRSIPFPGSSVAGSAAYRWRPAG